MDPRRFQQIKELVMQALDLPVEERSAFLDRECADNPELRSDVERMLSQSISERIEDLDARRDETVTAASSEASCGEPIGPYRLLEKIGEGGMGEVWVAEQTEPVRRRVALKVIKRGMDTEQVIVRFEAERQALALMDHPGITKIFDAGQTERGRPYFVMEYVEGLPITEYCDRHRTTMRERLELFVRVCEGVQHAHQKAVIHRDIKPSNVLVAMKDGKAEPKIIDFGVAKATAQRLTERTVYTQLGVLIGTPEYMSPEQTDLTGRNIDTRTDVYSLGVLLYELLTGVRPFDSQELRAAGFEEIWRRIREVDPPRPSTRVESLPGDSSTESARNRRTEPRTLTRQIRGDLDWITMKALEKDRSRRYGSASELAMDIGRYLKDEPVLAGPPSAAYRARKFVRRHRLAVATAGVLAASLATAIVGTSVGLVRARRAETEARREATRSERVSGFLGGMVQEVDPERLGNVLAEGLRKQLVEARRSRGQGEAAIEVALADFERAMEGINATDAALRVIDQEILARAAERIERELEEEPRIAGRLVRTIGSTYRVLGLYEKAEPHLLRAVELDERELGRDHPHTLRSMNGLAIVYRSQGRYDEAEALLVETLERSRVLGPDLPVTLLTMDALAVTYGSQGRYAEAEAHHVEALAARKRVLGAEHPHTIGSMVNLAIIHTDQGHYAKAEPLYVEALKTIKRFRVDDPEPHAIMHNLANLYERQGRYDEAEPLFVETLAARKRVLGADHPRTLLTMQSLAVVYRNQDRQAEAEPLFVEVLATRRRVLGPDHPDTLGSMNGLAVLYRVQGRYAEAEGLYVETLAVRKRVLGAEHPATLWSMHYLAALYRVQGRHAEAEPLFVEALAARRRVLGEDHRDTISSMHNLAVLYRVQGRYAEAEPLFVAALAAREGLLGTDHQETLNSMKGLAVLYRVQGRYSEAEPFLLGRLESLRRKLGQRHPRTAASLYDLARLHALRGNRAAAIDWLRQAIDSGFADPDRMARDPDLATLRSDPDFRQLLAEARSMD